jgi:hypothetical protein
MEETTRRCLWKKADSLRRIKLLAGRPETYQSVYDQFASTPQKRSFWQLYSSSVVVVQEITLTIHLLARHRALLATNPRRYAANYSVACSTIIIVGALLLILIYNSQVESKQNQPAKIKQRATDGILSAILLRLMASLLQSLTASYSSDTLYALVLVGFALHVLACDYSYANGRQLHLKVDANSFKRPMFHGGTVSLNSALFSTTLLVSRLDTTEAYFFVYFAVVLFAFYPATRNSIAAKYPTRESGEFVDDGVLMMECCVNNCFSSIFC